MDWNLSTAARTLWQECRGESPDAQRAVAYVILNRLKRGRWGKTLGAVCLARSQFSAWGPVTPSNSEMLANFRASCALADDDPELLRLADVMKAAMSEPDPTKGAIYYYNPKDVTHTPTFVTGDASAGVPPGIFCGQFGHQLFYRDVTAAPLTS
jgi:spore germination cell wall hydrolase CwlJ-like protein